MKNSIWFDCWTKHCLIFKGHSRHSLKPAGVSFEEYLCVLSIRFNKHHVRWHMPCKSHPKGKPSSSNPDFASVMLVSGYGYMPDIPVPANPIICNHRDLSLGDTPSLTPLRMPSARVLRAFLPHVPSNFGLGSAQNIAKRL